MDGRTNGESERQRRADGKTDKWKNEQTERHTDGMKVKWSNGQVKALGTEKRLTDELIC